MSVARPTEWVVVVPVKSLGQGKSRLSPLGAADRRMLLVAFMRDTLAAVVGCRDVIGTFVVSTDEELVREGARFGATSIPDSGNGLDAAVEAAADACGVGQVDRGFAVVPADLPCLTSGVLADLLRAASAGRDSWFFVPDIAGSGTTVLVAAPRARPVPCFGPDSARRHAAAGGVPLIARRRARLDVDTPDDLRAALRVGVGEHTAAVMQGRLHLRPHLGDSSMAPTRRVAANEAPPQPEPDIDTRAAL